MSYGKCVLSSDIPENMELTEDHGLTFETNNVEDLVKKLTHLLEEPDHVETIGKEARIHIAKNYDWKDIAETTEYLYELVQLEPVLMSHQVN